MVVDDSAVVRNSLVNALGGEPDLDVVGTASNGKRGVEAFQLLAPDIIVMDFHMPVLDGLAALDEIRRQRPEQKAVLFTSAELPPKDAMRVLAMPHTALVSKPSPRGSAGGSEEAKRALVDTLRQLLGSSVVVQPTRLARQAPQPPDRSAAFEVLLIGSSTGGPDALAAVAGGLPADLPVPVVIAQHMPAGFTAHFAERLDAIAPLTFLEGKDGVDLEPGQAHVAPGGLHLVLERVGGRVRLRTDDGPRRHACRPAVDPLFESGVDVYGAGVLALILTGMGRDGADGACAIRDAGGRVLVQDEATSVVWGMPGAVVDAGAADEVLSLDRIAGGVVSALKTGPRRAASLRGREAA